MIIEEKDFRLIPVDGNRFDLELLFQIQGKNPRAEFKNVAYSVTLDYALTRVANHRLNNKHDTVNLATYLKEFKQILKDLSKQYEICNTNITDNNSRPAD